MTLPDGNTGLDTVPSVPSARARLAGVQIRVAFGAGNAAPQAARTSLADYGRFLILYMFRLLLMLIAWWTKDIKIREGKESTYLVHCFRI
jgi:hypothetical protein